MQKGDYVIVKVGAQRPFLLEVAGMNKKEVWGTSESDRAYDPQSVTVLLTDVMVNLGSKPPAGVAYSVLVEPYTRTEVHDFFGDVHWFFKASKDDRAKVMATLTKAQKLMTKHGLKQFFPVETEVRVPKGKMVGKWIYQIKGDERRNKMVLRCSPLTDTLLTVLHECGHGVYHNLLTSPKGRAQWIKVYHDYVELQTIDVKEVSKLFKAVNKASSYSDFRSSAEERELLVFDLVLAYINDVHNLRTTDVSTLMDAGESLEPYWPTSPLDMSDFKYDITEYAGKNQEEMFCECFAFHLAGKKLPKHITKLMEKTLTYCANRKL
jgi:hypothetical protein